MPALMISRLPYRAMRGEVDLDAGPVRAALAGTYDLQESHDRWSDFVESIVEGGLYVPGGIPVPNFEIVHDGPTRTVSLLGDDLNFLTMTTEVIRGVMFYLDDGATRPLLAYHRFDQFRVIENAPFTYYLADRLIAQFKA
jgi:hypothetical protein